MTGKLSFKIRLTTLISVCAAVIPALVFFGCAGSAGTTGSSSGVQTRERQKAAPSLIVKSPQEAIYNGQDQAIIYSYTGEDIPDIVYYSSRKALEEERGGSYTPPRQTGTYYVHVRCLYEEVYVEYTILRSPVEIITAPYQEAVFNGNPRRVRAEAKPEVPLSYSYYPNRELRDSAIKAEEEAILSGEELAEIFKGYKRIDRAPTEQGTYYVWIYFPGDKNHQASQANVEFAILPAPAAAPRQR